MLKSKIEMKNNTIPFLLLCLLFGAVDVKKSNRKGHDDLQNITLLKTTKSWDGNTLLKYPDGQPEITVFKGILPPGATAPLHTHPTIGSYYIIKGNLTVYDNEGNELNASEGNAYSEVVNKWHYGINNGKEPVELIFFFAGQKGTENIIFAE